MVQVMPATDDPLPRRSLLAVARSLIGLARC